MLFIGIGIIFAVVFFVLQLLMCYKGKRIWIKCIPMYLILLGALFSIANFIGLLGYYSAGAISGNELVAIICVFFVGTSFIGALFAWIVYGINHLIHRS